MARRKFLRAPQIDQEITEWRKQITRFVNWLKSPEDWTNITYQNGWSTISGQAPLSYHKDDMGYVHIRGGITGGTATDGTVVGNIPANYRPEYDIHLVIENHSAVPAFQTSYATIKDTGDIEVFNLNNNNHVHFVTAAFRAYS